MAHFGKDLDDFNGARYIHIRSAEQNETFTAYVITVTVGPYSWTVKHRYSEFYDLHEKLCACCKLDKGLLPPKKIFGNQTEAFIKKRQRELEIYLQTILFYLAQHVPTCLTYFLDFDKYEIHGITQSLAEDLYSRGEHLLQSRDKYVVSSLQLYSLTERLKLPEPTCDSGDVKKDLGHILDFITRAKYLKVVGGSTLVGTSNIMMNKLVFDLTLFKSLQTLEICGCNFQLIKGLEIVKQTLLQLEIHESSSSLKEMLLQDCPHWKAEDGTVLVGSWDNVTTLNLSNNSISDLHDCIQLMPNVENLNLSHNELEAFQNLQWLSQLTYLDLSHNKIRHLDSLHTKLGNVKVVRLAHNQLDSLKGFAKLYSLQTLDVTYNNIVSIEEVLNVSQLPCVENFILIGNTVTSSLDYRTKTLEMFGDRVREVKLDNQVSSEKELSTVAVLQALRKARNTKTPRRFGQSKNPSTVSLTESFGQSPPNSYGDQYERSSFSAAVGPVSSSVPTSIPWPKDETSQRSASPYSQDSVSSYSSNLDSELTSKQDFTSSSSPPVGLSQINVGIMGRTSGEDEDGMLSMIPEAHPFDLSCPVLASGTAKPESSSLATRPRGDRGPDKAPPVSGSQRRQSGDVQSSSEAPSGTDLPQKRTLSWMYNAADLPKMADQNFVLWLNKQLSTSQDTLASTSPPFNHSSPTSRPEIIDVVWCYAQPLSQPDSLIASCAILTSTMIFIEKLLATESTFPGMPELEPLYILPMKNIQQMVIGPCYSFLRLEEAFVGKSGTFTLYCLEPLGVQNLSQRLFSLCQKLNFASDVDCVDLNSDSDLLKRIVKHEEDLSDTASDRLVLMIPVRLRNDHQFHFLLLSENRVYCVNLRCALWPPPCFESLPKNCLPFEIIHEFSITDKLVHLKIHPDKEEEEDSPEVATHKSPGSAAFVDFIGCQISLTVETKTEKPMLPSNRMKDQCLTFKYLFPSLVLRDHFLDRFSNLRAEQANRMSPNVREEPEGGNEQLSDSSSIDSKVKSNLNNSNSSVPSKISRQSQSVEDMKSSQPISYSSSCKSQAQADMSVPESFRSFKSSSSESFQSIIESEGTDLGTADYRSSSPKEDNMSVSPMSNFSRASISPPLAQVEGAKAAFIEKPSSEAYPKNRISEKESQRIQSNFKNSNAASKADSLPSSFDWKKFYFTAPPEASVEDRARNTLSKKSGEVSLKTEGPSSAAPTQTGNQTPVTLIVLATQSSSYLRERAGSGEPESELDGYLKKCTSVFNLINPLSTKMKPLCLMSGGELRKFFHAIIASNSHLDVTEGLAEELHHVLWAAVIPYTNPKQEITTLVMLSTYAVYLVSDTEVKVSQTSRPSWMTHSRNQSDSAIAWKSEKETQPNRKTVKPYLVLKYKDLHQIHIGLFDQCVRLTGYNENEVFTIATRDSQVTEVLIEKLKQVLSLSVSSPMLERSHQELEQDFYRDVTQRTKTTIEGLVYTHPSQVNFVYPGDEAVNDVLYLIRERAMSDVGSTLSDKTSSLWQYILCYLLPSDDVTSSSTTQPRTILMTSTHFALAEEDIVTYPLPDFVRGLPENPCHEILDCRAIDCLKRVQMYHSNPHWLSLTFVEEQPELVVDVTMQHFAHSATGRDRQKVAPEVNMKFFIQNVKERDKLVQIMEKLWKQQVAQVGRILDVQKI